jgi:hypothetical protein
MNENASSALSERFFRPDFPRSSRETMARITCPHCKAVRMYKFVDIKTVHIT